MTVTSDAGPVPVPQEDISQWLSTWEAAGAEARAGLVRKWLASWTATGPDTRGGLVHKLLAFWTAASDETKASLIREVLLAYAWAEDSDKAKAAVVDCIMAQDDWPHVTALADSFAGAQFEPGPEAFAEGIGYAVSALYECHDGPHLPACAEAR